MNNYLLLSQSVVEILGNKNLFGEEVGIMQDHFLSSLIEVMKVLLDKNVDEEVFYRFMEQYKGEPDQRAIAHFVASTVETEESYIIMSYFFSNMIGIYYENALEDGRYQIDEILLRNQVGEDVISDVSNSYKEIVR